MAINEDDEEFMEDEPINDKGTDDVNVSDDFKSAIMSQLKSCWIQPSGLKNLNRMSVDVVLKLSESGKIVSHEILSNVDWEGNTGYNVLVDSVEKALLKESCSQLVIPSGKYPYSTWKKLEVKYSATLFGKIR